MTQQTMQQPTTGHWETVQQQVWVPDPPVVHQEQVVHRHVPVVHEQTVEVPHVQYQERIQSGIYDPEGGIGKLVAARSRLYRSRFLPPNIHFSDFFEIYKINTPLNRSKLRNLAKMFLQSFGKILYKIF